MELIRSLGIDGSLPLHLVCFLVGFLALRFLVFAPYTAALRERELRTLGTEEVAARVLGEIDDLQQKFEAGARTINQKIREEFDRSRSEAMREYDRLVQEAQSQADQILLEAKSVIAEQLSIARKELQADIPQISAAIAQKIASYNGSNARIGL